MLEDIYANPPGRDLSMTTVFRDDLIRIQVLRRKFGDDNSQKRIERALTCLEDSMQKKPDYAGQL